MLHDREAIGDVRNLTEHDYQVRGSTALLDAIGKSVHHIERTHRYLPSEYRPEKTIFVIITDGYENASRKYSAHEIKRLIAESPPAPELTPRQLEILNSMARGYSNAEIAEVFGINEVTVREHVANIMAKLDASNRAEAVATALRKSLLKF